MSGRQTRYEALSNTWGAQSNPVQITLNGKALWITYSLVITLQHMRLPYKERTLWADALCINQSDVLERTHKCKSYTRYIRRPFKLLSGQGLKVTGAHQLWIFYPDTLDLKDLSHFLHAKCWYNLSWHLCPCFSKRLLGPTVGHAGNLLFTGPHHDIRRTLGRTPQVDELGEYNDNERVQRRT